MKVVAPIDLKEWFQEEFTTYLQLIPTSTSTQPVHVLNGYFNQSLSGKRKPGSSVKLVSSKQGNWVRSNAQIHKDLKIKLPKQENDTDRLRYALQGLIATDRAVFTGVHSFQLAHLGLVSSDRTHQGVGELAARLTGLCENGIELLNGVVSRLSSQQANPHWLVESFLSEADITDLKYEELTPVKSWLDSEEHRELATNLAEAICRGLRLVKEGEDSLIALQILAYLITWVGMITYAQVPSIAANGKLSTLLCEVVPPGTYKQLRDSSASSITVVEEAFAQFVVIRLREKIKKSFGDKEVTEEEMKSFLEGAGAFSLSGGNTKAMDKIISIFEVWKDGNDVIESGARALQDTLGATMGNKQSQWFAATGRHCGFLVLSPT